VTAAAAEGKRVPSRYLIGPGPWASEIAGLAGSVVAAGKSVLVVTPTVVEARRLSEALQHEFGSRVLFATSSSAAKETTAAWVAAATNPGIILVGTREVALWPVAALGLAVVVEEGRRAMKAPQSPTIHAFELVRRRAAVERFSLVMAGPVPTLEAVATGAKLVEPPRRVWGLVEVIDRGEEPPGSGVVSAHAVRALQGVVKRQGRAFVLVNRRDYAPAFRCVRCREVRRCRECGAGAARTDRCRRCGAQLAACANCGGERFEPLGAGVGRVVEALRRIVGGDAGPAESGLPVLVGTERDLVGSGTFDVGLVVDADGLLFAPHYRAEEDAFRLMARLASQVVRGRGNRCLIQTSHPRHRVIEALRSGHPSDFLEHSLTEREREGFPPTGQLLAVGLKHAPEDADATLRLAAGSDGSVFGPAVEHDVEQWLIQGTDLRPVRVRLRRLVQSWRDGGATVRIDADPIAL
jgi:primosomal protein N' (replication factor Y)